MRTLVHLSDLHFGAVRSAAADSIVGTVAALRPDLVVISGDLTQRARRRQFVEARAFLDRLPSPQLVVPGNHDVPLYNLLRRFCRPLARYRRYISAELEPMFCDGEIAVLGLNTARSLTFKNGRVNERQIAQAQTRLAPLSQRIKIIVTHHPFDLPQQYPNRALVGRARMAMAALAECGLDLFLAGHHHVGLAQPRTLRFNVSGHGALLVQAGTAISTRCRGELNSFNLLRIANSSIEVERHVWQSAGQFLVRAIERFERQKQGWSRCTSAALSQMEGSKES